MTTRRVLIPAVVAAMLALTGCGGGGETTTAPQTSSSSTSADPDGRGVYDANSTADLPEGFPGDLPLPVGLLVSAAEANGGWVLTYQDVREGQYERLVQQLQAAGYKSQGSFTEGGIETTTFRNSTWKIIVGRVGQARAGLSITYAVSPLS